MVGKNKLEAYDLGGDHEDGPVFKGKFKVVARNPSTGAIMIRVKGDNYVVKPGKISRDWSTKKSGFGTVTAWKKAMPPHVKAVFSSWTDDGYDKMQHAQMKGKKAGRDARDAAALEDALARAPKYKGRVFRGLDFTSAGKRRKFVEDLRRTGRFRTDCLSSWSRRKNDAADFAGDEVTGVMLTVRSKSSVKISGLSQFGNDEHENLYPKGVKFKVDKIQQRRGHDGMVYVSLSEA